jgi:hypothetical protein
MSRNDNPTGELNARQRRFVAVLATGEAKNVKKASEIVGVSEATGYRYWQDETVRAAITEAQGRLLSTVSHYAVSALTEAIDTLRDIHKNKGNPPGVRVSAARALLDAGPRLHELVNMAERVAALEALIEGIGQ